MRFKILLHSKQNTITLPINYNYLIRALIYDVLPDDTAKNLHDKGYFYKSRYFKLFTFSKLYAKRFFIKDKNITFTSPVQLFVGFADNIVAKDFASNLLKKSSFRLQNNILNIEYIEVIESVDFMELNIIKTLSPIVVYKTFDKKKRYFLPNDKEFLPLIKSNLAKKYAILAGKESDFDLKLQPLKCKKTVIKNYGNVVEGVEGRFILQCPPPVLEKVYDAGLGANNSSGFGMVEVIDET
ncbi:CRISPR-associated endoribonuclease Cas6 [Nitratiruptor sp. YY08-26]|uniref:CRISPR-associated endoribonuclease Cas6 n=1 Tax=unclassified Nitratiruptor TaxID=2624044 RepID=UPI001916840D|nr:MULTISPECIES: CRISPR-associated endoribonuclease Cas6 [unclassified Nitratiruptor]BCD61381.1 CRISPR-associated endoribonuclease Cas6 [Nitratiruptor sp. YY08-13]BCD65315.1 CRISPR-associated endoribonuclease Cas6 [Nitratiruptor sp. YY08-26]